METALAPTEKPPRDVALKQEFGPLVRGVAARYFEDVRFPSDAEGTLAKLHETGFVVHVMRSTSWVNYLYLTWALIRRGLPPVRAVVNLRRWFTRPWRKTAQRGDFDVRFTYARRHGGSGLIFLKRTAIGSAHGKNIKEDPFPALVEMARRGDRTVYLVPELFVWEKKTQRLKPSIMDRIFGSPEAPGFLHTVLAFWRNHKRAQFRVGEPIDLRKFALEHPDDPDEVIARKVRSALHHHLAKETRAVFGPPIKPTERLIEETLRDRVLRDTLIEHANRSNKKYEVVEREARRALKQIAARVNPTVVGFAAPMFNWVFNRIYDGIVVDEPALERAMKAGASSALVLCPSHKSHVDYLVLSSLLWNRGYNVPLVAAGANLSFFPLGPFFRRAGAFFLRRSFKGDVVYTAAFKAYVKKLIHDGVHQEFFPEGGRSRTGKFLKPKLGLFTWQVEAMLEGAREDVVFVPVSIDYEKVVETRSYSRELAGGEKKPEDLKALLSAPRVLTQNYGRIHVTFDEPVKLSELMKSRGLTPGEPISDEQKKGLVRALGNRVMWGIARVSTVTPHALVAAALLGHRRRGITARELTDRILLLRRIAEEEGTPLSTSLDNAPSDPTVLGAIQDAVRGFTRDELVRTAEAKGELICHVEENRRSELSFYKNTLMNLVAPRSLVASAVVAAGGSSTVDALRDRVLFLSRLFKIEFIYRVGETFDTIFAGNLEKLIRMGLVVREGDRVATAPEKHSQPELEFLANLLQDFLESYLLAGLTLEELERVGPMDRKAFVKAALETGRGEFLAGNISAAEALSRTNVENAVSFFLDRKMVVERDRKLQLDGEWTRPEPRKAFVDEIREYLPGR